MVSRDGAFGILMAATVGTLFLVPAHGSAQDSLSVSVFFTIKLSGIVHYETYFHFKMDAC